MKWIYRNGATVQAMKPTEKSERIIRCVADNERNDNENIVAH